MKGDVVVDKLKVVIIIVKVDSEGEDKNGCIDDFVEVVEKVNILGMDKLV